jgi:hypothetical protein
MAEIILKIKESLYSVKHTPERLAWGQFKPNFALLTRFLQLLFMLA